MRDFLRIIYTYLFYILKTDHRNNQLGSGDPNEMHNMKTINFELYFNKLLIRKIIWETRFAGLRHCVGIVSASFIIFLCETSIEKWAEHVCTFLVFLAQYLSQQISGGKHSITMNKYLGKTHETGYRLVHNTFS